MAVDAVSHAKLALKVSAPYFIRCFGIEFRVCWDYSSQSSPFLNQTSFLEDKTPCGCGRKLIGTKVRFKYLQKLFRTRAGMLLSQFDEGFLNLRCGLVPYTSGSSRELFEPLIPILLVSF
jgi:hypothetical protein